MQSIWTPLKKLRIKNKRNIHGKTIRTLLFRPTTRIIGSGVRVIVFDMDDYIKILKQRAKRMHYDHVAKFNCGLIIVGHHRGMIGIK